MFKFWAICPLTEGNGNNALMTFPNVIKLHGTKQRICTIITKSEWKEIMTLYCISDR